MNKKTIITGTGLLALTLLINTQSVQAFPKNLGDLRLSTDKKIEGGISNKIILPPRYIVSEPETQNNAPEPTAVPTATPTPLPTPTPTPGYELNQRIRQKSSSYTEETTKVTTKISQTDPEGNVEVSQNLAPSETETVHEEASHTQTPSSPFGSVLGKLRSIGDFFNFPSLF